MNLPMIIVLLALAVYHNCPVSSDDDIHILFPDSEERIEPKPDQDGSDDVVLGARIALRPIATLNKVPLSVKIVHPHPGHKVYSGSFVEFKCRANGSKPPFQFTWWKGGNQITTSSVRKDNINRPRIGSIRFKPEPSDDGLILRCQVHSLADKDDGEDSRELTVLSTCRHMPCASVNEECEDSDGTTAGACQCKSGYIRDSSNNCIATCRHMSCASVNEECEDSDGTTAGTCQCKIGYIRNSSNSCVATCRHVSCSSVNEECDDSDGTTAGTCQCKSGYIQDSANNCVDEVQTDPENGQLKRILGRAEVQMNSKNGQPKGIQGKGTSSNTCEVDSSSNCAKLASKGKCGKGKIFWKCKSSCACGVGSNPACTDTKSKCSKWAAKGKCSKKRIYTKCKSSCACA